MCHRLPGWAVAGTALLLARERFVSDREAAEPVRRRAERLLGSRAMAARSWDAYLAALPRQARGALADLRAPRDLWLAENRWWNRVERDGFALLRGTGFGLDALVGCVALLAVDAHRVQAALEIAARGGRELEAFDALG